MAMIKIRSSLSRFQRLYIGGNKVHPIQLEPRCRGASHCQMTKMNRVKGAAVESNVFSGIVHSVGKLRREP